MPDRNIRLLFALFALSGFTGLIYESVWSHYLKLFLGSAAFAQSFVLAAFMGGMAAGAWLASRWSGRLGNLLAVYGWIEAGIGVAALVFHEVYGLLTAVSLDRVIPALGASYAVEVYKYALCSALIVPQTVLLGMTFPLLSGAVIRREPQASGHHLGMLYFTNSIGAAAGALAAAFLLIGWLGMPGTMRIAGAANLLLAAAVLALARRGEPQPERGAAPAGGTAAGLFLGAAFVTGAASFVFEIVWTRMLSLVLGASFQAFELMLSAFIAGLALGGWWIGRRIDRIADPARYAGMVVLGIGLAALGTIFVYHRSFDWMGWAISVLQRSEDAYPLFTLFSHAIAFAVMLPATFLAGVTLPLLTHALLRGGRGERAIGQVYAANTLGAIVGALVAVHVLMPALGAKLSLVLGAAADIVVGAWLLRRSQAARRRVHAFAAVLAGLLAATATARADVLRPERLASGVFRYGHLMPSDARVVFYRDGKTASVAVTRVAGQIVVITTNGKPDAAITLDPQRAPVEDEVTMTLLGALPLLIKPEAKTFANIGFGSGLTAEVLLSHRGPQVLDTVEIEPAMAEGARAFLPRVSLPWSDPRSRVAYEDAKSYFARHDRRYDVIISEPSNPWVNGVASLFTTEFYREAKRYLAPGGLFVQWLQLYELDDRLLGSMLAALGENFADYEFYDTHPGDIVVVAVAEGGVPPPRALPAGEHAFLGQLARLGILDVEDIAARSIGTKRMVEPLFRDLHAPVNSDFRPFVQLEATRARFARASARAVPDAANAPLPILEMTGARRVTYLRSPAAPHVSSLAIRNQSIALRLQRGLLDRAANPLEEPEADVRLALLTLKRRGALCGTEASAAAIERLHWTAEATLAHLAPPLRHALWVERRWLDCGGARLAPQVRARLDLYAAVAARDARRMLVLARAQLERAAAGDTQWRRFLLLAAMLGARAAGDHAEADRLWRAHGAGLYPASPQPSFVRYLANLK